MVWTTPSAQIIDKELVKKATEIVKLNLSKNLFTSTDKKSTIQYLFSTYYNKSVDFYNESVSSLSETTLNNLIRKLRNEPGSRLADIYDFKVEGEYGPGEVLFYLLVKDATLGGKGSKGADLILPSQSFEIKAARKKSSGELFNFKLGDIDFSSIINELRKIKGVNSYGDINKTVFDNLRAGNLPFDKESQKKFLEIEKQFQNLARTYFKNSVIFISTNPTNLAEIYAIKSTLEMQRAIFFIDVYTQNTLKPIVKF